MIAQHDDPDVLFYIDPPYPLSTRSTVRSPGDEGRGYRHEMTDAEHEALADRLHAVRGMVAISSYRSDLYDRLYGGWASFEADSWATGGILRREVLWLSPAALEAGAGLFGLSVSLNGGRNGVTFRTWVRSFSHASRAAAQSSARTAWWSRRCRACRTRCSAPARR